MSLFGWSGGGGGGSFLRQNVRYVYYGLLLVYLFAKRVYAAEDEVFGSELKPPGRYEVAKFNFDHVSDVYAITLWILLGSLAKVGFHLSHKLTEKCPESCLLIILGLVVGGLLYATKLAEQKAYVLNSDTFFLFLLPPIILEAGYFMPNRPFFDNIGTILLFAIANTLFNTIIIGLTLWGFTFTPLYGGVEFEMLHCFVFAALISAVDPVAVLATFVEIHVNDMLYIVVFGESLLNDAVSVVLYRMFDAFADMGADNIIPLDIVLGCTSFLIVAFGGVLIGIVFGVIACFTTKFTEHTPVLEPLIILTYSYLSYLTAEMFSTSGILAITFCGMFMKQYVEFNIAKKSNATIEYVLKMLASIMETIIFMFMGLSTVSDHHSWNTGFVLITLVCCTLYRIIGVLIFANIANRWRLLELTLTDMLIMSYGGIRGAVAFALALILDESKIPRKKEFVTATIAVVFFTVFVQGTTIGPIVKYFKVKRKEIEEPTMSAKLTNRLIDHIMSCLEDIAGVNGKHSLRDKVRTFDRKFFKPFLLREKILSRDEKLLSTFQKIKELNVNKMAENPEFVFPTSASMAQLANLRNESIGNFFAGHRLSEIVDSKTVPDFQKLEIQPSKRADEDARIHHMLDMAMFDPRRKQAVHKRSQLDEDTEPFRRSSRSRGDSSGGMGGGGGGGGGLHHNITFHHQNPLMMRPMIDLDKTRYKSSGAGGSGGASGGQKKRGHHHHQSPHHQSGNNGGGGGSGGGSKSQQARSSSAHPTTGNTNNNTASTPNESKSSQNRPTKSNLQTKKKPDNLQIPTSAKSVHLDLPSDRTSTTTTATTASTKSRPSGESSQQQQGSNGSKFFIETPNDARPVSPSDLGSIPPPWKSAATDPTSDEPVLANMPTWANNPNYTLHATSTKPDQSTRKAVFDIFDYDDAKTPLPPSTPRDDDDDNEQPGNNSNNKKKNSKSDPTTAL